MHPEQVKAEVRKAGFTQIAIAEELGVTGTTVSQVIRGVTNSARIKNRIAQIINKPVNQIWKPKKSLNRKSKKGAQHG